MEKNKRALIVCQHCGKLQKLENPVAQRSSVYRFTANGWTVSGVFDVQMGHNMDFQLPRLICEVCDSMRDSMSIS